MKKKKFVQLDKITLDTESDTKLYVLIPEVPNTRFMAKYQLGS